MKTIKLKDQVEIELPNNKATMFFFKNQAPTFKERTIKNLMKQFDTIVVTLKINLKNDNRINP